MMMAAEDFLTGPVARRLGAAGGVAGANGAGGFELRPQQIAMAAAVEAAFRAEHHLIVEAGTGVGKSFAYLIPAIAQVAAGKKVVISTHTISLQEQLIEKDIPFLRAVSGEEFSAVLCKGRSNYLCQRRLEQAGRKAYSLFEDGKLMDDLTMIEAWAKGGVDGEGATKDGSLSDLPRQPAWNVWDKVCAERGNCLGRRCKFFTPCFYQASRRRMNHGQILVCNHAMFFSDLALRRAGAKLLPDYDFVVLDEAHTIEAVASDHFGLSLSEGSVRYLLHSLFATRTQRGFLATLEKVDTLAAAEAVGEVETAAERMFDELARWLEKDGPANGRVKQKGIVENPLGPALETLGGRLRGLLAQLQPKGGGGGGGAAAGEQAGVGAGGGGEPNAGEEYPADEAGAAAADYEREKDRSELRSYIQRVEAMGVSLKALRDAGAGGFGLLGGIHGQDGAAADVGVCADQRGAASGGKPVRDGQVGDPDERDAGDGGQDAAEEPRSYHGGTESRRGLRGGTRIKGVEWAVRVSAVARGGQDGGGIAVGLAVRLREADGAVPGDGAAESG